MFTGLICLSLSPGVRACCWYLGALELADTSGDLPGLKWMAGVTSWKVLRKLRRRHWVLKFNLWTEGSCFVSSWWLKRASGSRTGPRFPAVVTRRSVPPCSHPKTWRKWPACTWRDGTHARTRIFYIQFAFMSHLHTHSAVTFISSV